MPTIALSPAVTPQQAAQALGLSVTTLYRLLRDRDIESIRIGHGPRARIRIPLDELERFAREGVVNQW